MEWLIAHDDEPSDDTQTTSISKDEGQTKVEDKDATSSGTENIASDSDNHDETKDIAAKKKITVEEAQRLIIERQAKRVEEERKKEIENEKRRRVDGQKMAEVKAELQDQERINLARQIRREKIEKELHKKRVMEQIARDREAIREKNNPSAFLSQSSNPKEGSTPTGIQKSQNPKAAATECKIALRFPDGSSLVHKFSPSEQLSEVKLYAQREKNLPDSIEFVAPPNRKFTNSMMNQSLEQLGLCPASRLEVKQKDLFTDFD